MLLWFVGTAIVAVWYVFRDPRFDYRLLVVGALVPELDGLIGGARVLHSLLASVVLLAVAIAVTAGRRPARRLLLGLPIGTMLHLVVDGGWRNSTVFWWPLGGWGFDGAELPSVARGWWNGPLELIGLALCKWIWRTAGLADPDRRRIVARTGQLFSEGPG